MFSARATITSKTVARNLSPFMAAQRRAATSGGSASRFRLVKARSSGANGIVDRRSHESVVASTRDLEVLCWRLIVAANRPRASSRISRTVSNSPRSRHPPTSILLAPADVGERDGSARAGKSLNDVRRAQLNYSQLSRGGRRDRPRDSTTLPPRLVLRLDDEAAREGRDCSQDQSCTKVVAKVRPYPGAPGQGELRGTMRQVASEKCDDVPNTSASGRGPPPHACHAGGCDR